MKPSTGIADFLVDHVLDLLLYVKLFQLHAVLKNIDSAQIYLFIFILGDVTESKEEEIYQQWIELGSVP